MKKVFILKMACFGVLAFGTLPDAIEAHCQMPCGIYHDDLAFDLLDQYGETMFKAVTVLNQSKFETVKERNAFMRWVMEKDRESDQAAEFILKYFLQQKIKAGEPDTAKKLESAHKLLLLLVNIKQNVDRKLVEEFIDEWEKFKLMFHIEGYECKLEQMKKEKREALRKAHEHDYDHEHDHDHDHDHK